MSFKEQPLDGTIEFGPGTENGYTMILGNGQTVYWKDCNVTVYDRDDEGNRRVRLLTDNDKRSGQGMLDKTDKLYITDGKVRQI